LSATTVTRLKAFWQDEYQAWSRWSARGQALRVPVGRRHHFNIRLEDERQCILVLMGTTPEGAKERILLD